MITESDIKKSVVKRLKNVGFLVFATELKEGFSKPAVFVNIYPTLVELFGDEMEDVTDTVEIKYIPSVETTEVCADAAQKIRLAFMHKPLKVNDRNFTVQKFEADIEDCVLYIYFDVSYTQAVPDETKYENMEELIIREGGM